MPRRGDGTEDFGTRYGDVAGDRGARQPAALERQSSSADLAAWLLPSPSFDYPQVVDKRGRGCRACRVATRRGNELRKRVTDDCRAERSKVSELPGGSVDWQAAAVGTAALPACGIGGAA
jgi:hypothetical protein